MWVCFNDAFVSAVQDVTQSRLKIRARKKEHLQVLFPKAKIFETHLSDYRFRVFVTKKQWAKVLVDRVESINYDNFKNSVKDHALHNLYADFWHLHYQYQDRLYPYPMQSLQIKTGAM